MSNRRLTRDTILAAATELMDQEGYDGLTIRRLAARLGVTPMAMYRHFDTKGALIGAIIDQANSEIPLPPADLAPREALSGIARGIRSSVLRHPSLVPALVVHPSLGPSALRSAKRGYAALLEAGLHGDDVWRSWNMIAMYAIGFAFVEAPRATGVIVDDATSNGPVLEIAEDPEIDEGSGVAPPPSAEFFSETQFEYGLEKVLASILGPDPSFTIGG